MVSHRISFDFDTGARIVGYLSACKPAEGPVLVAVLARADVLGPKGEVLEHHGEFSLVPNVLSGFRVTEGPGGD
jgi:hypothetical protein